MAKKKSEPGAVGWTPMQSSEANVHLLENDDSNASSAIRELFRLRARKPPAEKSLRARYEALAPDFRRVVDLWFAAEDARLALEQLGFHRGGATEIGARAHRELARALEAFLSASGAEDKGRQ